MSHIKNLVALVTGCLVGVFLIPACQSTSPDTYAVNPDGLEATVEFTVEGVRYKGVASVQRKSNQKIEIDFPKGTKWGLFATCHRVIKHKSPEGHFTWRYIPEMYLENMESCIMIHKQIDRNGNPHYGILDFSAGEQLDADVSCNGVSKLAHGASICQGLAGTYQKIWFKKPVQVFTDDKCEPATGNGFMFLYKMTPGFCGYLFKDSSGEFHRHTTYGFQTLDLQ